MRKKKEGSSLVLVLIFTLFFTAISGVVVLAVVGTTKANSAQEVWEDTYYAAESAVETAVVKASKNEFASIEKQPIDGVYNPSLNYELIYDQYTEFPECTRFMDTNITVKVIKTGDKNAAGDAYINEYFLIEATSKNTVKNQERTIKAMIKETLGTGDIFKYMICGKGVYVTVGGAGVTGDINSTDFDASIIIGGAGAVTNPNERASFILPEFTFPSMSIHEVKDLSGIQAIDVLLNMANAGGTNGVKKIRMESCNKDVYLVNMPKDAPNLEIETASGNLQNKIILTNGNIEINASGAFLIQHGSIIGNEVKSTGAGSITLQIPPYGDAASTMTEGDLEVLNSLIAAECTNWDAGGSVSGSDNYWDTMEYK